MYEKLSPLLESLLERLAPEERPLFRSKLLMERVAKVGDVHKWSDGQHYQKMGPGNWQPVKQQDGKWVADPSAAPPSAKKAEDEEGEAPKGKASAAAEPSEAPEEKPEKGGVVAVDPTVDSDGDGVADASRVGIPARDMLPPPALPRLPNLKPDEAEIEDKFNSMVEQSTEEMTESAYNLAKNGKPPFVFETDAAKNLLNDWTRPDLPPDEVVDTGKLDKDGKPIKQTVLHPERLRVRAQYNTPIHQAANAITKKAFIKRLDEIAQMPEEQRKVLVTCGGCAAGKGMGLKANPELTKGMAATWDAAGEQNATENPWIMEECEKRGIRPSFLFVEADPRKAFQGAINRAKGAGRMVDARAFADSYALGAKNHAAFAERNKDKADFVFVAYDHAKGGSPDAVQKLDGISDKSKSFDADGLYDQLLGDLEAVKNDVPEPVYAGATAGRRIWGGPKTESKIVEAKGKKAAAETPKVSNTKTTSTKAMPPKMSPEQVSAYADLWVKSIQNCSKLTPEDLNLMDQAATALGVKYTPAKYKNAPLIGQKAAPSNEKKPKSRKESVESVLRDVLPLLGSED